MAFPHKDRGSPRLVVTERDLRLITSIADCRYLTVEQIERLHFPSEQTAVRRLRALSRAGYLTSFRIPGLEQRFVSITEAGAELIRASSGREIKVPRRTPTDAYFLRHFCALNDLRIALEGECGKSAIRLVRFIPEYEGDVSGNGVPRKSLQDTVDWDRERITHTPDGVAVLEHNGRAALLFVEIDRGTETLSDGQRGVLKMLRFYLAYLVGEGYQRYATMVGVTPFKGFRVLLTTTSPSRLANMRALGGELAFEPAHAKRFIWLATQESVTTQSILGPVWRALEPTDDRAYSIAPNGEV